MPTLRRSKQTGAAARRHSCDAETSCDVVTIVHLQLQLLFTSNLIRSPEYH